MTLHASLREQGLRQTEGVVVHLQLEPKCFYTPSVLLSSGGWGVLLCLRECVCAFGCGVVGGGRGMKSIHKRI